MTKQLPVGQRKRLTIEERRGVHRWVQFNTIGGTVNECRNCGKLERGSPATGQPCPVFKQEREG